VRLWSGLGWDGEARDYNKSSFQGLCSFSKMDALSYLSISLSVLSPLSLSNPPKQIDNFIEFLLAQSVDLVSGVKEADLPTMDLEATACCHPLVVFLGIMIAS
jgi:hypothetical protein